MYEFTSKNLEELKQKAAITERRRTVHRIHPHDDKGPRVIINSIYPSSYGQPHLHETEHGE